MNQPKYMYLIVFQDDAYGPVYPTKKAFYNPSGAQSYCAKLNREQDDYMYFVRELHIMDQCT